MENRTPKENGKDLNGSVVFWSSMGGRAYCLSLGPQDVWGGAAVEDLVPEQSLYIAS